MSADAAELVRAMQGLPPNARRHVLVTGATGFIGRRLTEALASAGHKWMCAGYGAGFCYVSRALVAERPPRAVGWLSGENPYAFDNRQMRILASNARSELGCPAFGPIFALGAAVQYLDGIGADAIAERVLSLNSYLTTRLSDASFEVLSPGGEHRSGQTLVGLVEPTQAALFLRERGIHVTEKPQGVRISTHFYNSEAEVDACVEALVAYRDQFLP